MADTPKYGIQKLDRESVPRVDKDFNKAVDVVQNKALISRSGLEAEIFPLDPEAPRSFPWEIGTHFHTTDTAKVFRYNGSQWIQISPLAPGSVTSSTIVPNTLTHAKVNLPMTWNTLTTPAHITNQWEVSGTIQWGVDRFNFVHFIGNGYVRYKTGQPANYFNLVMLFGEPGRPPAPKQSNPIQPILSRNKFFMSATPSAGGGPAGLYIMNPNYLNLRDDFFFLSVVNYEAA